MRKLLNIGIYLNGEQIAQCNYIKLEAYAISTARKFTFKDVIFNKKVNISYKDKISVGVSCFTTYNNEMYPLYEFNILLLDFDKELQWVYGLIYHDYEEEYRQGILDVFNIWEKKQEIDWFTLPLNNVFKTDYISACLYYSSVNTDIIDKDIYTINVINVKEYRDVLYLLSEEFFGERGYIGHNFHSFADCLLEISIKNKKLKDKKLIFKNTENLFIKDDNLFFENLVKELSKYGIIVFMQ